MALLVTGMLVTGCGAGPSRVDSAAVVGDTSIPLSTAQSAITSVLARPGLLDGLKAQGASEPAIGRAVVSQLVIRDLLADAGAARGVAVSEQQVTEQVERAGGEEAVAAGSLAVGGPRESARDDLALAAFARTEIDRLSVTADVAIAQSREEAVGLAQEIAAGGARAEAALAGSGTTQRGLVIRPVETPQAALTPLIGIPAGWVAAFGAGSGQGWLVVRVTDRTLGPPAPPEALAQLDQRTLAGAGVRMLTPTALDTPVELNPRYGVWDPIRMSAVESAEEASVVLRVAASPAAP
ncbi:hypothetical protein AFB00_06920 [Pseudonocardia sp. HH130630-07]|nr:hypothetical protein AFB00_06920 [Pseudonocardia sp. HH130630-07]